MHLKLGRKLRLWDHPEDKNEKISLGVSLKQNTWSVHELPTSVDAIASRANLDGSSSSGEGRDGEFNFDNYDSNGSNVDNGSGNKKGGGTNLLFSCFNEPMYNSESLRIHDPLPLSRCFVFAGPRVISHGSDTWLL